MHNTVLPANNTMPAFPSWRSPDVATTATEAADIQLQLLIYRPRKDERLSWPGWFTCSGWFTHLSGHPSATGRAQDSESMPAKYRRSSAGPRNQPRWRMNACLLAMLVREAVSWPWRSYELGSKSRYALIFIDINIQRISIK